MQYFYLCILKLDINLSTITALVVYYLLIKSGCVYMCEREAETERKYTICSQCVVSDVNPHAYAICLKVQVLLYHSGRNLN